MPEPVPPEQRPDPLRHSRLFRRHGAAISVVIALVALTALTVLIGLAGCAPVDDLDPEPTTHPTPTVSATQGAPGATPGPTATPTPTTTTPTPGATPSAAPTTTPTASLPIGPVREGPYPVLKVVDGDTVRVDIDGTSTPLRLIGVDTPETVHPSQPVECYGPEASAETKDLLTGRVVYLVYDGTQGRTDRYGRHLVYLELTNHTDVGEHLIAGGWATEYTYAKPYARQSAYRAAQERAQRLEAGLWGACPA